MPEAHAIAADDPIAAIMPAGAARSGAWLRRIVPLAGVAAVGVAVAVAAPKVAGVFADAFVRAIHADPRWVIAGIALEIASFAGYVALFWHVAGRSTPRIGLRASYEVALASTAATRLLPTAGAGGAALTFWSLKRAGNDSRDATRTLLTFLVVLYAVFLGSIVVAGTLLATGVVPSGVSLELSAVPAALAAAGIALALFLAARHDRVERPAKGKMATASYALGGAVRDAVAVVRRPHARLLGAPAWWGFDMLVIWATFSAFGTPPSPVVLVLGYFLGQVANTLPLPGAASGGMVGAFLAFGMPAEVVLPAVLAYRAIAIWTPVPAGAAAIAGLRRTVRRWSLEDADTQTTPVSVPHAPRPSSLRAVPAARTRSHRPSLVPWERAAA